MVHAFAEKPFQPGAGGQTEPRRDLGGWRQSRRDQIAASEVERRCAVDEISDLFKPQSGQHTKRDVAPACVRKLAGDLREGVCLPDEVDPGLKLRVQALGARIVDKQAGVADDPQRLQALTNACWRIPERDFEPARTVITAVRSLQFIGASGQRDLRDQRTHRVAGAAPADDDNQHERRCRREDGEQSEADDPTQRAHQLALQSVVRGVGASARPSRSASR